MPTKGKRESHSVIDLWINGKNVHYITRIGIVFKQKSKKEM